MDCIFCKIVNGSIPSQKVYEDSEFLAFLDIHPVNKGHLLVIPKEHHETIVDVPPELLSRLMLVVQQAAEAVRQVTHADGFNIVQNNYRAAGQEVPHIHFHIIPRFSDDGLRHWPSKSVSDEEMSSIRQKLKDALHI